MDSTPTWLVIAAAILGGGASGAAVQYLAHLRQAREVRSRFLVPLGKVEQQRWAGQGATWQDFAAAGHELRAAAVMCRIPKQAVETYLAYAAAACRVSHNNYENRGMNEPEDGSISHHFGAPPTDLAHLLSDLAWRPKRARLSYRSKLRSVNAKFVDSGQTWPQSMYARRFEID